MRSAWVGGGVDAVRPYGWACLRAVLPFVLQAQAGHAHAIPAFQVGMVAARTGGSINWFHRPTNTVDY
jgi:hypothetical protein